MEGRLKGRSWGEYRSQLLVSCGKPHASFMGENRYTKAKRLSKPLIVVLFFHCIHNQQHFF
jgi:hypothetical protein